MPLNLHCSRWRGGGGGAARVHRCCQYCSMKGKEGKKVGRGERSVSMFTSNEMMVLILPLNYNKIKIADFEWGFPGGE